MEKPNPYATNKLLAHPTLIRKLRAKRLDTLTQVHLMPQNACNQGCEFCAYRLVGNPNADIFDTSKAIPWPIMEKLLWNLADMEVKAVEVTGGGEPLAYPKKYEMFELLFSHGFDVALVTNGTLLTDELAALIAPKLMWMRVSIDAGTKETYSKIRHTKLSHFDKAWDAVRKIRLIGSHHPEFRLGVGYVVSNDNELELFKACQLAKDAGADNIRLSIAFSYLNLDYFKSQKRLQEAVELSRKCEELNDTSFQVINLIPERYNNVVEPVNEYHYCYSKDVITVIEGTGKVYTCCTFTGSTKGILGNFIEHPDGFEGVWRDSAEFRHELDPKVYCRSSCLYRKRNLDMIGLVEEGKAPIHINFI